MRDAQYVGKLGPTEIIVLAANLRFQDFDASRTR